MATNGKLAVIGDKDSVLAFKSIGMDVFCETNVFAIRDTITTLSKQGYAVIFICEKQAALVMDTIEKTKTKPYPAIIPIPDSSGTTGLGMTLFKKDIERAIGADILFKN